MTKIIQNTLKKILAYTALSYLAAFSINSHAEDSAGSNWMVRGVGGLAVTYGGDKLATVYLVSSGGSTDSDNLKAGSLLYLYGGASFKNNDLPIQFKTTLGYHFDSVSADDGSVTFSRLPLDFIGSWGKENNLLGIGVTHHLRPELDLSDAGAGSTDFDDATGFLIEYEHRGETGFNWAIRYTFIEYDVSDFNASADGDSLSLHMIGYF